MSRIWAWRTLPLLIVAVVVGAVLAFQVLQARVLERHIARGDGVLRLAVDGLEGAIDQFAPLPALIAERPILGTLLLEPENAGLVPFVNEQLRQTAFRIGASDVFLMDLNGLTIAASNYRKETSFIGRRFDYRPYVTQAVEGGLGRYFALGTTSGERGYYFSAPVLLGTRVIGVVAVKMTVDAFEEAWQSEAGTRILVRDLNDIVFMSSEPDWLFRALRPLSDSGRDWIERTRQYPLDQVMPLPVTWDGEDWLTVAQAGGPVRYAVREVPLRGTGLVAATLVPVGPARLQALMMVSFGALVLASSGLIAAIVVQRRAALRARFETQAAAQARLEERVAERTSELKAANSRLIFEVQERTAAEHRLRETQAQLVQAGKLAALGQMSAALSHEINQPLAAVKSYADNAVAFLDRADPDAARDNVTRISRMADRMASISASLRSFARRPKVSTGPTPIAAVLDEALAVTQARMSAVDVRVTRFEPEPPVWAIGGRLRLQQVVVNLLSNALDAMESVAEPRIDIGVVVQDNEVRLSVRDYGSGIREDVMTNLFDPFFTTKDPGRGLGLGLSISYNIVADFGGTISAANAEGGGALFTVTLRRAEAPDRLAAE